MNTKLIKFLPARCWPSPPLPAVHAQFYKLHGASISVGATGNYLETLTDNPRPYSFNTPTRTGFVTNYHFQPAADELVHARFSYLVCSFIPCRGPA